MLGDADRKEIRFNQQKRATRPQARNEIRDRGFCIRNVVKHRASGYETEAARIDRAGDDIALSRIETWRSMIVTS